MTKKGSTETRMHPVLLHLMDVKIRSLTEHDEIYLHDERDEQALEERYASLPLSRQYKRIIDDYHACTCSKFSRAVELAYLAGAEAALQIRDVISTPDSK